MMSATSDAQVPAPKKRWGVMRIVRLVVSLGLLGWVIWAAATRDGTETLLERLREVRPWWIVVACLLPCLATTASSVRWHLLLREEGVHVPFPWAVRHTLIGRFVGAFTPSTTGLDGYRTLAAARRTGQPAAASRALVLEKVVGLAGLAAITVLCAAFGVTGVSGETMWIGIALCLGASATGYAVARNPSWFSRFVPRWKRLGKVRTMLSEIAGSTTGRGPLAFAFLLGLLNHAITSAVFVAAAWAVNVDLGGVVLFGVGNAIVIATLLPVSVGGVGMREGTAVMLLGALGVAQGHALLMAVVGYLSGQTPAILGGLLSAFHHEDNA